MRPRRGRCQNAAEASEERSALHIKILSPASTRYPALHFPHSTLPPLLILPRIRQHLPLPCEHSCMKNIPCKFFALSTITLWRESKLIESSISFEISKDSRVICHIKNIRERVSDKYPINWIIFDEQCFVKIEINSINMRMIVENGALRRGERKERKNVMKGN